jgi:hypothetical protein
MRVELVGSYREINGQASCMIVAPRGGPQVLSEQRDQALWFM